MNRWKEVAKFACGFEAFHALFHAYLWAAAVPVTVFGITLTRTLNGVGGILGALAAILFGAYAWRRPG